MNARPKGARPTGAARFSEPTTRGRRGWSAVGSTLALLALVAGVPVLLLLLAGPVSIPTSWPTTSDFTHTVNSAQVLDVLVVVVWLAWLQFMVCVVVEVLAALHGGVLAAPIPFSGPSQRLARLLVASVLLAGTVVGQVGIAQAAELPAYANPAAGRVVAAAAPFSQTGAGANRNLSPQLAAASEAIARRASADLAAGQHSAAATVLDKDEQALDGRKVYVVEAPAGRHHESLWAIAERHLGDGRRYHEIYRLNEGRTQPNGESLQLARLIQPGWRLVMPEDAVGVARYVAHRSGPVAGAAAGPKASAPEAGGPAASAHAVAPGPAASAHAVAPGPAASAHAVAPGPAATEPSAALLNVPNRSEHYGASAPAEPKPAPTQAPVATAPASTAKPAATASAPGKIGNPTAISVPTAVSSAPALDAETPPAGNRQPLRRVTQQPAASQQPVASAPAVATPGSTASASHPTVSAGGPDAASADQSEHGGISALGAELIGAGLLAAALLSALLVIRRRRGNTSQADPDDMDTETWLRTGADADRGALLDLALRSLPKSCRDVGRQLPQAYGAVVDDDGLDLLLTMSHPSPPPPWTATDEGLRWRVTYADAQHLVADGDSAYPLLASVGRDPQGRDALINLGAAAGPISVVGSPAMAAAVVRALALGLAGNPWSRGIEVLTCDLPATLPAIAAGRLVPCAGARDLTEQLEQGSGRMPRTGPIQILTGGPAPGSRPEQVAIYGAPLNAPIAQRLQALVTRRTELAVLVTGELPGAAWRLKVDDAGNLSCDELSLNVTANRLGDGSVERLHALFISASTVGPPPGMPAERVMDEAGVVETDDVTWAQAAVRVSILGEVEVRAPGMIEAGRLPLFGEIVAYLALHPAGAHPTVLASAIWPRGVTSDVRDGTLAQVRDWLGTDSTGAPRLREGSDGRMRLSPEVPCDWDVLRTLVGRAGQSGDRSRERDLLIRALHLVRGPVVGGITHGTYTWLPRTDLERQAETLIVDAADRLSQICADEGDQVAVEQAAAAGLRAVPEAQHLWRHIIRAEHTLGGPARLARVTEHLRFALSTSGVDVEPETQALIDHLSSPAAASGNAS